MNAVKLITNDQVKSDRRMSRVAWVTRRHGWTGRAVVAGTTVVLGLIAALCAVLPPAAPAPAHADAMRITIGKPLRCNSDFTVCWYSYD